MPGTFPPKDAGSQAADNAVDRDATQFPPPLTVTVVLIRLLTLTD